MSAFTGLLWGVVKLRCNRRGGGPALGVWGKAPCKRSETPGGVPDRPDNATQQQFVHAPHPAYDDQARHFAQRVAARLRCRLAP